MRHLAPALLLATLSACSGGTSDDTAPVDSDTDTTVACTEMAVASVNISTVDPSGAPLAIHEVVYTVDGGPQLAAECIGATGGAPCSSWVAGWEVAGDFVIEAVYTTAVGGDCCWFEDRQSTSVTVGQTADGCHVEPQQVTITLDPTLEACHDTACP